MQKQKRCFTFLFLFCSLLGSGLFGMDYLNDAKVFFESNTRGFTKPSRHIDVPDEECSFPDLITKFATEFATEIVYKYYFEILQIEDTFYPDKKPNIEQILRENTKQMICSNLKFHPNIKISDKIFETLLKIISTNKNSYPFNKNDANSLYREAKSLGHLWARRVAAFEKPQ
jgi:hypothetical protein